MLIELHGSVVVAEWSSWHEFVQERPGTDVPDLLERTPMGLLRPVSMEEIMVMRDALRDDLPGQVRGPMGTASGT